AVRRRLARMPARRARAPRRRIRAGESSRRASVPVSIRKRDEFHVVSGHLGEPAFLPVPLVEEGEGADHAARRGWKDATDGDSAEVAGARGDHVRDHGYRARARTEKLDRRSDAHAPKTMASVHLSLASGCRFEPSPFDLIMGTEQRTGGTDAEDHAKDHTVLVVR